MANKRVTKQDKILAHLRRGWKLTNEIAFRKYNYTRLGSIIFELRQDGIEIDTIDRVAADGTRYAEYRLHR